MYLNIQINMAPTLYEAMGRDAARSQLGSKSRREVIRVLVLLIKICSGFYKVSRCCVRDDCYLHNNISLLHFDHFFIKKRRTR
jgi:hypothetical protein